MVEVYMNAQSDNGTLTQSQYLTEYRPKRKD